jgi:predicted RNase H-like nuclease (RuvC/YqgF family)
LLKAVEHFDLGEGDYVYLEDASGGGRGTAESLFQRGIAGVAVKEEMPAALREHFLDLGVPVYSGRDVPVRMINGMPFARPEQVEAARAAWEEESIARRARLEAERLEGLFEEYRVERKKEEKRKKKAGPVPSSGGAAWMTDDG